MKTPFTPEQFFSVFEKYNLTVFPFQALLLLLGISTLIVISSKKAWKDKFLVFVLGFTWLWTGIVYHIIFFTEINAAAYGFGSLFILQGLIFLWSGLIRKRLNFVADSSAKSYIGLFFMIFALVIYPFIGYLTEQNISHTISYGLPCPTTIFTFGILMFASDKLPKYLLIIPSIWSLFGISAMINLGVYQDIMMIVAAVTAWAFLAWWPVRKISLKV
jgi:hypothetical protein